MQPPVPESRDKKQQRRAQVQKTVSHLGANLKDDLDDHIFNAKPLANAPIDPANPVGLHAYTNGELPDHLEEKPNSRVGRANKVHIVTWRHKSANPNVTHPWATSTMFPKWMSQQHVRTLVGLHFPDTRKNAVPADQLAPDAAKKSLARGTNISLKKAGGTVYPTHKLYND